MKLKKQENRDYILRGEKITLYPVPAIEVAKISNIANGKQFKSSPTLQINTFAALVHNYTSLKDQNSLEDIKENMTFDELSDLSIVIMGMEEKVENFIKDQNTGLSTIDSV